MSSLFSILSLCIVGRSKIRNKARCWVRLLRGREEGGGGLGKVGLGGSEEVYKAVFEEDFGFLDILVFRVHRGANSSLRG